MLEWLPLDTAGRDAWRERLLGFPDCDVYYLPEYVRAFQLHGDGIPILIYYADGDFQVANVVMKRDVNIFPQFKKLEKGLYFELNTPYGYGGFLSAGTATPERKERFFREYSESCRRNGIVFEFFRFHPVLGNFVFAESLLDYTEYKGRTITMKLGSPEEILDNLSGKNRNMVRKAQKNGVVIRHGKSPELYARFREIYTETMRYDQAAPYYYFGDDFFRSIREDLRDSHELFYAVYDDQVISMAIILFHGTQMHYHLSGSLPEYRNRAAGNLLLYEAATFGSAIGCKTFHLGGGLGADEENGLFKFKAAFYPESETVFHIGGHIHNPAASRELLDFRAAADESFDRNNTFFPCYRG